MKKDRNASQQRLYLPQYWLSWLAIALLWILGKLPLPLLIVLGRSLGAIIYYVIPSRRHIGRINIELCFPQYSKAQKNKLLRETINAHAIGLFETAAAWFQSPKRLAKHCRVEGLAHLQSALEKGGVLMTGGHGTTMDLCATLVAGHINYDVTYRAHNNPVFNHVMTKRRHRVHEHSYTRKDIRGFMRSLKNRRVLWYAPDQDYGRRNSVFVDFFGVPAATVTSTSKLARSANATVVPIYYWREGTNYVLKWYPPLPLSGDEQTDARTFNAWLEQAIMEAPEQYYWLHKRFKTRREGEASFYKKP